MLIGFNSIFNEEDNQSISHITDTPVNRKRMATDSINYNMKHHNDIFIKFNQFINPDGSIKTTIINEIIEENPIENTNEIVADYANEIVADYANEMVKNEMNIYNQNIEKIKKMSLYNFDITAYKLIMDCLFLTEEKQNKIVEEKIVKNGMNICNKNIEKIKKMTLSNFDIAPYKLIMDRLFSTQEKQNKIIEEKMKRISTKNNRIEEKIVKNEINIYNENIEKIKKMTLSNFDITPYELIMYSLFPNV
jgi:lipoate synthase